MTYVMPSSRFNSLFNNAIDTVREYMVEVVKFDGNSESFSVEASSEEDAQMIAASMVDDADYIMIQGCY